MTSPVPGPPRPVEPGRAGDPHAAVAAAIAGLDGLGQRPLAEHVAVFERVHELLGAALAEPGA